MLNAYYIKAYNSTYFQATIYTSQIGTAYELVLVINNAFFLTKKM